MAVSAERRDGIARLFQHVGCSGQLCAQADAGTPEVEIDADAPVVAASVIKLLVAVEAQRQFADGRLDPCERVTMPSENRTPGPTGFSLYADDVDASARDLVVATLTISDNAATDALLARLGVEACNETARSLGLSSTPVRVSAKSGGLIGVIRNEVGVIDYPDGQWYAAAVFTQAHSPSAGATAINAAIGEAAAKAIGVLRSSG